MYTYTSHACCVDVTSAATIYAVSSCLIVRPYRSQTSSTSRRTHYFFAVPPPGVKDGAAAFKPFAGVAGEALSLLVLLLSVDGFNAFPQAVPFLGYAVGAPQSLPWPIPVTFRQFSGFPDIAVVVWALVYFCYWISRLLGIEFIWCVIVGRRTCSRDSCCWRVSSSGGYDRRRENGHCE